VGWIYEYALIDRSGRPDLAQLRPCQDWFLKVRLQSLPTWPRWPPSRMVKQKKYQILIDPVRLRAYGISLTR